VDASEPPRYGGAGRLGITHQRRPPAPFLGPPASRRTCRAPHLPAAPFFEARAASGTGLPLLKAHRTHWGYHFSTPRTK
jgi:hypothetical protein